MTIKTASALQETEEDKGAALPSRKRLSVEEREKQILSSAIQFFSEHGLNGQMRVLAQQMGITHTLFYHYFPTKQALIDRVYYELFEGRCSTTRNWGRKKSWCASTAITPRPY